MSAATDSLDKPRRLSWRGVLDDEVDASDVDSEFERACADEGFQFAFLKFLLRFFTQLSRQGPVVYSDSEPSSDCLNLGG